MTLRGTAPVLLAGAVLLAAGRLAAQDLPVAPPPVPKPEPAATPQAAAQAWLSKLSEGLAQARRRRQPVFVRVGSASCPWCRKLEAELRDAAVSKELGRWTLVALGATEADRDARALAVGPIAALRLLTPDGRVVASRDGFLPASELLDWLTKHHDAAAVLPVEELTAAGEPDAAAVLRLVGELKQRDPALREAAIRRLLPHPQLAAKPVAEAFAKGSLQSRLSTMELLREWQAPVQGLDPWRAETLTAARLDAVTKWAAAPPEVKPPAARELTAEEVKSVRQELARMAAAPDAEAAAIRERLARHGLALLPEVYAALKDASTDAARERLTALRYRLAAGDALALKWPGGVDRLASTRQAVRHEAVQELARRATAAEEPLLLELFGNPDPFVRELSLRTLHAVGGRAAAGALARLLRDPDPNVRAAVLKQLAEKPSQTVVPKIAEFVAGEADVDLVVHAVRVLRAAGGEAAVGHLRSLLKHPSWRVRADAAEAISEVIGQSYSNSVPPGVRKDAHAALREALSDPDGFVVGRAIGALKKEGDAANVEPLVKAAAAHPELAGEVVDALGYGTAREKALPHLREFCRHKDPAVRAKAVAEVCDVAPDEAAAEVRAGLTDPVGTVRRAAAAQVFRLLENKRAGLISEAERAVRDKRATKVEADPIAAKVRGGEDRPKGLAELAPLLTSQLRAGDAAERLEAALALLVLDREKDALPVLLGAATADAHLVGRAARALPWLPWERRFDLYGKLLALGPEGEPLEDLVRHFAEVPDARAAAPLWELAGRDGITTETAEQIARSLAQVAQPGPRYGPRPQGGDPTAVRKLVDEARAHAKAGPEMRRLVALVVLAGQDRAAAAEAAAGVFTDADAPAALRRDALQVMLLTRPAAEATAAAVAALAHPDRGARRVAVQFLSLGAGSLQTLHERHIYLGVGNDTPPRTAGGTERYVPKVPAGLDRGTLRKLLRDPDPVTAAGAGYLLALLGDATGLPDLVRHWRESARDDGDWVRLVAAAVACLDDDANVPVLEEVYRELAAQDAERRDTTAIRDLYWIVRPMGGPNALRLRKTIRAEIGMGALGTPGSGSDPSIPPN